MRKMLMCAAILLTVTTVTPVAAKPLVASIEHQWTDTIALLTDVHFAEEVAKVEWVLYVEGKYVAIEVVPLDDNGAVVMTDGRDPNVISEPFWLEDIPYTGSIVQLQTALQKLWLQTHHQPLPITFTIHP